MRKKKHNGLVSELKNVPLFLWFRSLNMALGALSYWDFRDRGPWHNSNFSRTSSYLILPSLVNIFPVFSSNGSTFVCTWCPVSGLCRLILGLLSILTSTVASIFPGERDQHKSILSNSSVYMYERIHERVVQGDLWHRSRTAKTEDHARITDPKKLFSRITKTRKALFL